MSLVDLIVYMYSQTSIACRFAYIFWSMFIVVYAYTWYYEKMHKSHIYQKRKFKLWNYPFTLYVLGILSITIHHASIHYNRNMSFPWDSTPASIIGFIVMAVGLTVICLARACIDGYWATNIYDYAEHNELITKGIYKYTRHPVYDGQLLMTIGTVMLTNNMLLLFFPVLTVATNIWRAKREDFDLNERFPEEFTDYKSKRPFFMFLMQF